MLPHLSRTTIAKPGQKKYPKPQTLASIDWMAITDVAAGEASQPDARNTCINVPIRRAQSKRNNKIAKKEMVMCADSG